MPDLRVPAITFALCAASLSGSQAAADDPFYRARAKASLVMRPRAVGTALSCLVSEWLMNGIPYRYTSTDGRYAPRCTNETFLAWNCKTAAENPLMQPAWLM